MLLSLTHKLLISPRRLVATLSYIALIIAVNTLYTKLPNSNVYGQHFSYADITVGLIYIVRDFAQREIKHYVIIAMIIGAIISYLFADKTIAVASLAAFVVGESIDWLLYSFTKKPLSKRLLLSSLTSSPVDSLVFLTMASRLHAFEFSLMTLSKILGVLLLWTIWKLKKHHAHNY